MRRIVAITIVLFVALIAGCLDMIDHHETDGGVDGDMGSGSSMSAPIEESPRDGDLELVVLGASAIIALVPVGALRRRRGEDKDVEPQFS